MRASRFPPHFVDMAVFTAIIFSTNGYTSPFFLFFILPLLSAAIRWGWRETALTAAALVLFYITAGLLVAGSHVFELQRFVTRSGHLVILSAVLIWFGMHQQFTRLFLGVDELDRRLGGEEDPIGQALMHGDAFGARALRRPAARLRAAKAARRGLRMVGSGGAAGGRRRGRSSRPTFRSSCSTSRRTGR